MSDMGDVVCGWYGVWWCVVVWCVYFCGFVWVFNPGVCDGVMWCVYVVLYD